MKNRIASLFLVFALLMSLCNFAVARDNRITVQSGGAERFTDVPESHWAYAYINKVVGSGLFNGKTPTTFEPSSAMTRSQFVMVMARMEGRSDLEGVETQTIFPDVTTTRRAAGPIKWATDEGFVNGFGDGTFKPDSPITRGQFAALIHRYIVAKRYVNLHVVDPEPAQFTDAASVSTAFTNDVEYARIHGLLTGYSDGTVRAGNPITRAAIAAILARFLDLVTESGYTPLLDGPVIDGGDSGDSGNTGGTTPVDTPSNYDDIKMTVNGGTHGTTSVAVTRNGATVASDDLKQGDRVTITHVPESGYTVSVRIKDARGRTVTKHTSGNTTWFEAPANLPVTITVTYSKESSGGGGGGGGGSSSGGGGGSYATRYYMLAFAQVAPTAADSATHGTVFLSQTAPGTATELPSDLTTTRGYQYDGDFFWDETPDIVGWVVFVPDPGYELDTATISTVKPAANNTQAPTTVAHSNAESITLSSGRTVWYFSFTGRGVTDSSTTRRPFDVEISAAFKATGTQPGPHPGDEPDKFSWNITSNVTGGLVSISENPFPEDQAALTVDGDTYKNLTSLESGKEKKLYVAVSPDTANLYAPNAAFVLNKADANQGEDATIALNRVTKTDDNLLFIYELSITGAVANGANVTTNLTGAFNRVNLPYSVSVNTTYYQADGTTVIPVANWPTGASAASAPSSAYANDTVTVTVPVPNGYEVSAFTVKTASGQSIAAPSNTSNPAELKYTFTMPAENVTVEASIREIPPEAPINSTVTVNFEGEGDVTLNIGGTPYTFKSTDANKTQTISKYEAAYDANGGLPVYLVSAAPAVSQGYKLSSADNRIEPASIRDSSSTNAVTTVLTKTTTSLTVTVRFVKEYSFGYNLTIIGDGAAEVQLGDKEASNKASDSVLVETSDENPTVPVKVTLVNPGPTSKPLNEYKNGFKVTIGNESKAVGEVHNITVSEGTVDIVVSFLPAGAQAVRFTVESTGSGDVDINANNQFVKGDKPDNNTTATDNIDNSTLTSAKLSTDGTAKAGGDGYIYTGYAYEGTVITLTPNPATGYNVESITVTGGRDESPTDGFSYKLRTAVPNDMSVKFAQFDEYRVLVQAPYTGAYSENATDLHSYSQEIDKDKAPAARTTTLRQVLDSLNNGLARNSSDFTLVNGIKNNLDNSLGELAWVARYYVNNNGKTEAAKSLEEKLEKGVASNIAGNIDLMISSQQDAMLTNAKSTIQTQLHNKLVGLTLPTPTLDEATKKSIISAILSNAPAAIKNAYSMGQLTDDNFNVAPVYTVLKLETDENSDNITDKASAKGKSVEAQLMRKLTEEYLPNYVGLDGVDAMKEGLEAHVTIDAAEASALGGIFSVPISASATFTSAPDIRHTPDFQTYMNPNGQLDLTVWVNVKVTVSLTLANDPLGLAQQFEPHTQEELREVTLPADKVAELNNQLADVDTSLVNAWKDKWTEITGGSENSMQIALNEVITEDMIDAIVNGDEATDTEGLLTPVLNYVKVEALGDATATRAKIQNLYSDFVVFIPDARDHLKELRLKTKSGGTGDLSNPNDPQVVLKADGKRLLLTLDMNKLFREQTDAASQVDQTSYEKLIDLVIDLRDGVMTDIRNNKTDENPDGQDPKVVLTGMILKLVSSRPVTVTKWGQEYDSADMTPTERKELASLLAELITQQPTTTLNDAWKNFEAKGYSSVSLALGLAQNADMTKALLAIDEFGSEADLTAGFKLERKLK